jgi:hypothetical protein
MIPRTLGVSANASRFEGWTVPLGYLPDTLGRCRAEACRAVVLWARTPAGRTMPLDRDGTSHFATCPDAARFRRRRTA